MKEILVAENYYLCQVTLFIIETFVASKDLPFKI